MLYISKTTRDFDDYFTDQLKKILKLIKRVFHFVISQFSDNVFDDKRFLF